MTPHTDGDLLKLAEPDVDVLPDGRCVPAISDDALWALASTLHSNIPEADRPMGWSDFSPEQVQRLREAAKAFLGIYTRHSASSTAGGEMRSEVQTDEAVKLTYIKRWRTIVPLPAKYADEIAEALRAPAQAPLDPISANAESAAITENLAMMLRRMIWQINKEVGDSSMKALAGKAKQLLAKHNLQGPARRGSGASSVPSAPAQASGMREALEAAIAFIDTALVVDENPTMSKRAVMKIIRGALAIPSASSAAQAPLETLMREYARDLRRNSSGGDLSPDQLRDNESLADYLEELIRRALSVPSASRERPPLGQPPSWLQEQEIICAEFAPDFQEGTRQCRKCGRPAEEHHA